MNQRTIVVNDKVQSGYRYRLVEPIGKNFDPDLQPELTPQQLLNLGVFGGKYIKNPVNKFPSDWFVGAKLSLRRHDASLNYFRVSAGQHFSVWREKGWIHPGDPRGGVSMVLPKSLRAPPR
jgi:hypothetical protein